MIIAWRKTDTVDIIHVIFLRLFSSIEGYKMVYRGNIDGEKCDIKRYQPFRYFNSDGSNCIFQKSICKEEGQITIVKGSSKSDSKCTCDYTNGYAFITKTSNKCYCSPAEEDCSCYRKHCPHRYELSPGTNTYLNILIYE